jgi:hypothetical protein
MLVGLTIRMSRTSNYVNVIYSAPDQHGSRVVPVSVLIRASCCDQCIGQRLRVPVVFADERRQLVSRNLVVYAVAGDDHQTGHIPGVAFHPAVEWAVS